MPFGQIDAQLGAALVMACRVFLGGRRCFSLRHRFSGAGVCRAFSFLTRFGLKFTDDSLQDGVFVSDDVLQPQHPSRV